MYNTNMLPRRYFAIFLLVLCVNFSSVRSSIQSNRFNITLKTPGNTSTPTNLPHKSVHVKYTISNGNHQWSIVGIEPLIQTHQKAIAQLTVHLCNASVYQSIWYDDKSICEGEHSMLIYEWSPYSSLFSLRIPDYGFQLNRFQSIVLTVVYKKEKRIHKEQSGIMLHISTQSSHYQMGTMIVGNQQRGIRFSCRSSNHPRLLYGVKRLNTNGNNIWWHMYIIRVRQFGRKLVHSVMNSKIISNKNKSEIELVSSDLFLMENDYILVECEDTSQSSCYFLIYYTYKSKLMKHDNICHNNDYPNLFKLIPSKEMLTTNQTTTNPSRINGRTIFWLIFTLLLIIWISIIIGCIIMRRIRGLKNYRTEPTSPLTSQRGKCLPRTVRGPNDNFHHRTGDADHIMHIDGEHGGAAS